MGWLEWSSSVIGSVAWPIAAMTIAFVFRSQIAALFGRINELSWGDKSAKFAEKLDKAEAKAELVEASKSEVKGQIEDQQKNNQQQLGSDDNTRFKQLMALSPAAAVMDVWGELNRRLRDLADKHGVVHQTATEGMPVALALYRANIIPRELMSLVQDLHKLRNAAAHNEPVSEVDAYRFKGVADAVLMVLSHM